uniref:(northern house mosquito) hypothetical protein n=1 Tax=Culex pipiens TaxID=7175 RepID=A0A8D8K310_CULPI
MWIFFSNSRGKIVKSVTNECKNPSDDASQNMLDFVLDRFAVNDRSRIGKLIRGLEVAELTEDWFEEVYQEHTDQFWPSTRSSRGGPVRGHFGLIFLRAIGRG